MDTIEDTEIYAELQKLNVNIDDIKAANLRYMQFREIWEIRKKGFQCFGFLFLLIFQLINQLTHTYCISGKLLNTASVDVQHIRNFSRKGCNKRPQRCNKIK